MTRRICKRCGSRLSAYNRGVYCNACWSRSSVAWRRKNGKRDAYNPEHDLRKEIRERDDIFGQASGDSPEGIDGGAG